MGSRSPTETVARILVALLSRRTWSQADLARHVDLSVKALRPRLFELTEAGVPLEREEDHPHVYWSVPRAWFPSAAVLSHTEARLVGRWISRLPRSKAREDLLGRLVDHAGALGPAASFDEAVLDALEESATNEQAARIRYYSASRGDEGTRLVSVHRFVHGERPRFAATCHRDGRLKWFRLDRVLSAAAATAPGDEPFRPVPAAEVDRFVAESTDGFHAGKTATVRFVVSGSAARWAVRNLPGAAQVEPTGDGAVRVTMTTAGLDVVARFVVGLGQDATPEPGALRDAVVALARGALAAAKADART